MSERIHKEEMIRFAESPEGTMIWHRFHHGTTWYLINSTGWFENSYYVVDDEHAEHRKKSIDEYGKVEHDRNVETHNQIIDEFNTKLTNINDYSIAPKEWYEDIPEDGVWCWVSDIDMENYSTIMRIISYTPNSDCQFFVNPSVGYRYATPVTEVFYKGVMK